MLNATHISHSYSHYHQISIEFFSAGMGSIYSVIDSKFISISVGQKFILKKKLISIQRLHSFTRLWFYFDVSTYDFLSLFYSVVCFIVVAHAYNVARLDVYNARFRVNRCRENRLIVFGHQQSGGLFNLMCRLKEKILSEQ